MSDKVELTDGMILDGAKCSHISDCKKCSMNQDGSINCTSIFAAALQAERAKPKDDVWGFAPIDATIATVTFFKRENAFSDILITPVKYTRELPKSRIDLIAEKASRSWAAEGNTEGYKIDLANHIKAAILEAMGGEK